ncbi:hypothetical protein [Desulfosporosinus burensis]
MAHKYGDITIPTVWETINHDVPELCETVSCSRATSSRS